MTKNGSSVKVSPTGCPVSHQAAAFSFFERDYQEAPAQALAWSRAAEPVFYNPESDYWVVTRYDDVKKVMSDFRDFSAAITLQPVTSPSSEAQETLGSYGFNPCPGLVDADPPFHRQIRKVNAPVFMPDQVQHLEGFIRTTTNRYIDAFYAKGRADLVADLLWDVPCLIALQFLGVPDEDVDNVRKLATSMTVFGWGRPGPEEQVRAAEGYGQFWELAGGIITKLKEQVDPSGWLGHMIKTQRQQPDLVSDQWLQSIVMGGTMAAHETTTNATANAIVTLLRNREQWDLLCAEPERIPRAVEECLRHSSSVAAWRRIAKQDTEVGDVTIPADGKILAVLASANFDATAFQNPDTFDITREDAGQHIAFGFGTHTCLGNHVARLEMRIFLEILTARLPGMRLADQQLHYLPNTSFRGPEQLLIEW
ncbi:MAG: cytochrome P450 [Mycolicibacter arupensis]|jgi:cytochrome P450|uniref:Cytochrome P450 n=1 Tax=Mycolicibacter arupensis TaxID=342002 RepID=A0A5C7XZ22_9MYCO|nr:cytochrome P450 [Mycobacteroides abscessus]MDM2361475.1 cytochrome P450 [Mycobacteroides abscessus]TXI54827.1 MAG: cytochrome P450 [Mycolicibacter arupensis]